MSKISEEALSRLVDSRAKFLGFLRKRISSADAAEDLLQSAFIKSIEKGGELRNSESVVPWFYRVLRNSVVDYYRQSGRNEEELSGTSQETKSRWHCTSSISSLHIQRISASVCR